MKKCSLLVVDDDIKILRVVQRIFLDEDIEVLVAHNAQGGFELLEKRRIDIVLADHKMPLVSGIRFLKEVKIRYPRVIVMLMTAYNDATVLARALNESGIFRILLKPFDCNDLKQQIALAKELLGKASASKQPGEYINNLIKTIGITLDFIDAPWPAHSRS